MVRQEAGDCFLFFFNTASEIGSKPAEGCQALSERRSPVPGMLEGKPVFFVKQDVIANTNI